MRHRVRVVLLLLILGISTTSQADYIGVSCTGDSTSIVAVSYGHYQDPAGYTQFVAARPLGSCEPEIVLTPEAIPCPDYLQERIYRVTVQSVFPAQYVEYTLYTRSPDGTVHRALSSGDLLSFELHACSSSAIFGRGWLRDMGYEIRIALCEDHCWLEWPLRFEEAEEGWADYVDSGQLVNVYGDAWVDGMPGASHLAVSRVKPVINPAGCETVPTTATSWSGLKARH